MYVNFREGYCIFVYSTKPYIMTTVIANVRKEKKDTYAYNQNGNDDGGCSTYCSGPASSFFPKDRVRERAFVCIRIQFFPFFFPTKRPTM